MDRLEPVLIENINQVTSTPFKIKKLRGNVVSNITLSPSLSDSLRNGDLTCWNFNESFYFFENQGNFFRLYFASVPGEDIIFNASKLIESQGIKKPVVIEHIIRAEKDIKIGIPSAVLKRMSHLNPLYLPAKNTMNGNHHDLLKPAVIEDLNEIKTILDSNFNPFKERIPSEDELKELMNQNCIYLAWHNNEIAGLIIFQKEGVNLHLRYWWTHPEYRGLGIGSKLMSEFIKASQTTRRQFLWVFADNENAIKRYKHYGFDFDGTEDEIFVLNLS